MHYNNFNSQKVLIKERYSSITQKIMTNEWSPKLMNKIDL